jgi:hypothetical protein
MSLTVGQQIGSSMGHVEEVDVNEGGMGWGESLRVKINLDLQKPLMRGRMLKIQGNSMLIPFKYKRLPKFCFRCGVIKHEATGCSTISPKTKCSNGIWDVVACNISKTDIRGEARAEFGEERVYHMWK